MKDTAMQDKDRDAVRKELLKHLQKTDPLFLRPFDTIFDRKYDINVKEI